eukprot:TRINITY_DN648_c0_g1_i1.p1 TRINITY_DN648_c0_g1~~TRINITY_DN648_c0_g1_i1.p1  ORF type:complete len:158 (-),score=26.73 TRINITY_DN648_c0_g1_i1:32-460(-)
MNVNVRGVFLCMRAEIKQFRKQGASKVPYSIVNTSSVAGLRGTHGQSGYGASKAAVVSMTQAAAFEYAAAGIRINCINPAIIRTRMAGPGDLTAQIAEKTNPSKRMGTANEVINAVEFLLDERTTFINGICLPIDGGLSGKL